jgi:hypothetical protein
MKNVIAIYENICINFRTNLGCQVYTVKHVLRGHDLWDKAKVWPLRRGSIYMNFSMSGQEKDVPLIQVTA